MSPCLFAQEEKMPGESSETAFRDALDDAVGIWGRMWVRVRNFWNVYIADTAQRIWNRIRNFFERQIDIRRPAVEQELEREKEEIREEVSEYLEYEKQGIRNRISEFFKNLWQRTWETIKRPFLSF